MTIELRDYQQEAVRRVIASYERDPSGRELLVLPCAAGKTVIFSHIIATLARVHGTLALVVAHLDELLEQAADKYRMIQPDAIIGKIGSGVHEYGAPVTVASVATIRRAEHLKHLKALYGTGKQLFIVIDEAHLSQADGYQTVLKAFPDAFVLLVTATPFRLDGKEILKKPPLLQKTIQEMVRDGFLCNMRAIAVRTETSLDEIKSMAGDFNEHQLDLAINTPIRNKRIVTAYQEHTPGKRAIAFCVTVSHAEALTYAFNDAGISAVAISGKMPVEERRPLYAAFERGEILVLISVIVLSIGFDSPRAEVAILARPTQSKALYIQQVGRVLRLAPGKKQATILDITDNCLKHRIAPQSLKKILNVGMQDGETLLEAEAREEGERAEKEAKEKRALIRKLNDRRKQDITVNLFGLPEWQERDGGLFVLEVGAAKHRIALVPAGDDRWIQLYDVYARLAPDFKGQKWATGLPLDKATQLAEKKAHLLLEKGAKLVDRNDPWRSKPIDPESKQAGMLKKYGIAWGPGTGIETKGQAADAIDAHMRQIEAKKQAKAARKAAREAVRQERLEA